MKKKKGSSFFIFFGLAAVLLLFGLYLVENVPQGSLTQANATTALTPVITDNLAVSSNSLDQSALPAVSPSSEAVPAGEISSQPSDEIPLNDDWYAVNRRESYNKELQAYVAENVLMSGKKIELTARKENYADKVYTSGMVYSRRSYLYGTFEFVIHIPEGQGLFPAIWLMPVKGEEFPEIDLFEAIGSSPQEFYGVIHYLGKDGHDKAYFRRNVKKKDTYTVGLEWTKDHLSWFIDGKRVYQTSKGVPHEYMYLIANLAIGGVWPGEPDDTTPLPATFTIDSYTIKPEFWEIR